MPTEPAAPLSSQPPVSLYELAFLVGRGERVVEVAVARCVARGLLALHPSPTAPEHARLGPASTTATGEALHQVEAVVLATVGTGLAPGGLGRLCRHPMIDELCERLELGGLVMDRAARRPVRVLLVLSAFVIALVTARVCLGLAHDEIKATALSVAFAVVAATFAFAYDGVRLTREGRGLVEDVQSAVVPAVGAGEHELVLDTLRRGAVALPEDWAGALTGAFTGIDGGCASCG